MRCPGDEELLAFLSGKLAEKKTAAYHAHFDGCPSCRSLVVALAKTVSVAELEAPPKRLNDRR